MGNATTIGGGGDITTLTIEGTRLNQLTTEVAKVASQIGTSTSTSGGTAPQCGNPFLLVTIPSKKGRVRASLAFVLPQGTTALHMQYIETSLRTTQASFTQNLKDNVWAIDPTTLPSNGQIDLTTDLLDTSTQYDCYRLRATVNGQFVWNPTKAPAFNAAALAQFTTGVWAVNASADPNLNLLITNQLDPTTTKFDAEFTVWVLSPLTPAGAVQPWSGTFIDAVVTARFIIGLVTVDVPYTILSTDTQLTAPTFFPAQNFANRGFIPISVKNLTPGVDVQWTVNIIEVGGEKIKSDVVSGVSWFAGSLNPNPAALGSPSISVDFTSPNDANRGNVSWNFTQPAPPVALHFAKLFRKVFGSADSTYVNTGAKIFLDTADDAITGLHQNVGLHEGVHFKTPASNPNQQYTLLLLVVGIGGTATGFTPLTNAIALTATVRPGVNLNVQSDIGVPSALGQPVIAFIDKHDLKYTNLFVGGNFNQPSINAKYLVVYNGISTQCFDVNTYISTFKNPGGPVIQFATDTGVPGTALFAAGDKMHDSIPVKLVHLRQLFGKSATIFGYFYAENQAFGISAKSQDSIGLNLTAALDFLNSTGAASVLDAGVLAGSPPVQILFNGDYLNNNGTSTQLGNWFVDTSVSVPVNTSSTSWIWNQSLDAIQTSLSGETNSLYQNLGKRLKPGDYYALSFLALMTGSVASVTVSVFIQDAVTFVPNASAFVTFSPSSTYGFYGVQLTYNPLAIASNKQLFSFQAFFTGTGTVTFDRLMLVRGTQPVAFAPRVQQFEIGGTTGNENPDISVSSGGSGGLGISSPTGAGGAQGQWIPPGFGTRIGITQF